MQATDLKIKASPVDMESRKKLGIRAGDTVRVSQKIQEKDKTRIQDFTGIVLSVKHGSEVGATFTVRKVASGVGVEKTFPLYSPVIEKIEIVKRPKTRKAKLYHIRDQALKAIRRQIRGERGMKEAENVADEAVSRSVAAEAKADKDAAEKAAAEEEPEAEESNDEATESNESETEVPKESEDKPAEAEEATPEEKPQDKKE